MNIINSASISQFDKPVAILLWGAPNTGKSRFAATAPKPLFFDWDDKLSYLAEFGVDGISYGMGASDWDKFDKDFKDLCKDCKYETIVIDSMTPAIEACGKWMLRKYGKAEHDQHTYSRRSDVIKEMMYRLAREIPEINIIVICHSLEKYEKDGTLRSLMPALPGTSAERIASYFPEIYQSEIKAIKPNALPSIVLRTSQHRTRIRGSKDGIKDVEDPTWEKFLAARAVALSNAETKRLAILKERGEPSV